MCPNSPPSLKPWYFSCTCASLLSHYFDLSCVLKIPRYKNTFFESRSQLGHFVISKQLVLYSSDNMHIAELFTEQLLPQHSLAYCKQAHFKDTCFEPTPSGPYLCQVQFCLVLVYKASEKTVKHM